jgi:hypothetical protein
MEFSPVEDASGSMVQHRRRVNRERFNRLGSITLVRDAAEGVFDGQLVDDLGVIFIEPFLGSTMARKVTDKDGGITPIEAGEVAKLIETRLGRLEGARRHAINHRGLHRMVTLKHIAAVSRSANALDLLSSKRAILRRRAKLVGCSPPGRRYR